MMKQKMWNKIIIGGLDVPRGTIRKTMWRSSGDCVDTRLNSWNPTLSQRWIIPLTMVLPMGGCTLNIMSICYVGWRERAIYLCLCFIRNYRISWFCTCKIRSVHGILVSKFWIWEYHGLKKNWRTFSLLLTPIYCIVVVTSRIRWRITSPIT